MKEYTPENTIEENDLVLDKEAKEPITGIFKEKQFDSDAIRLMIPYKNGKEDGVLKSYYPSGELNSEMPYENGGKEGIQKDYYKSGKLKTTTTYKSNMLNGTQKWYYESKQLKAEYTFKDDIGVGIVKAYYENGKLYAEVHFKGGNLKGGITYDIDGNQKKVTSFVRAMDKFLLG